ncbi:hypothetical protein GYB29_10145 [bacterium]|nr:hypothetical protein [bacterium]
MGNNEPLEKKGKLFIYGIEDRVNTSLEFIRTGYDKYEELKRAIDFIEYLLSDTIKSDIEQLSKLGYYPATETEMELDHSIKHALIGSYKSAFADLRRALELSIIAVYLSSEKTERRKAVDWVMSNNDTPGFSKSVSQLITHGRFKDINDNCDWKSNLQNLYWLLSDFSHNKGQLKGYRELNSTNFFTAGTSAPSVKIETLKEFCDYYINTVKEIVAIQALYNPIILVGVPFDEKFGLEGPMSGFFNEGQAESVNNLIPDNYREYFDTIVDTDEEIKSVKDYFDSLPDLTEEDLKQQAERQKEFFEQLGKSED